MSLELTLLPLALAALEAIEATESQGGSIVIESRFKDVEIVQQALGKLGFESQHLKSATTQQETEAVVVRNERLSFSFIKTQAGNFTAVFPPGSEQKIAENLLDEITREYGRVLQEKLVSKIERSAAASGFRLGSRSVNQDRSVTLTLGLQ